LGLFKGNAVLDLAKLLNKGSLNQEGSTTYLQQLATNATEKQLIKAGIPKKYWRIVKNLPVVCKEFLFIYRLLTRVLFITARNKSAHESEIDFARPLISEGPDAHNYQFWKEIFPPLYGGSVEQSRREGKCLRNSG
jgi:hypothetical protein